MPRVAGIQLYKKSDRPTGNKKFDKSGFYLIITPITSIRKSQIPVPFLFSAKNKYIRKFKVIRVKYTLNHA